MGRKLFLWGIIIWSKWKIHFLFPHTYSLSKHTHKDHYQLFKSNVEFVFLFHFVNDLWHAKLNAVVDNNDWCWMVTLSNQRIHIIALNVHWRNKYYIAKIHFNSYPWHLSLSFCKFHYTTHYITNHRYISKLFYCEILLVIWLFKYIFSKVIYLSTKIIMFVFGNVLHKTKAHSMRVASMSMM